MSCGGNNFKDFLKNATAHKVNSYYTLAISWPPFCVEKHTILGPEYDRRHVPRLYVQYKLRPIVEFSFLGKGRTPYFLYPSSPYLPIDVKKNLFTFFYYCHVFYVFNILKIFLNVCLHLCPSRPSLSASRPIRNRAP